jgi:predicted DNA binding protein
MMDAFENMIKKSNEKNDRINKYMNTKNVETLDLFKGIVDFLVREKKANNKIINDIKKFEPIKSEIVYFNTQSQFLICQIFVSYM